MTPFLFQTRTLVRARWQKRRLDIRPRILETQRQFHGSLSRQSFGTEDEVNSGVSADEKTGSLIEEASIQRGVEPQFSGNFYGTNEESQHSEEPSLKETITTRPQHSEELSQRDVSTTQARALEPLDQEDGVLWRTDYDTESDDLGSFYDVEDDLFDETDEADAWARDVSQERRTTITSNERAAFEAIFRKIRRETKSAEKYGDYAREASQYPGDRRKAIEKLEGILGVSIISHHPQTRDEKEAVVNRYPPSLRALAARAVGLDHDEAFFEAEQEAAVDDDQIEAWRRPVREELEARMRAAKTDVELWDLMKEAVFPLFEKLGWDKTEKEETGQHVTKPVIKKKPTRRKNARPSEPEQILQLEPIIHNNQVISPLSFYGPLYPSCLLLGLRLLDRSFAKPSPLTLSILPKIKSLGHISHVLGASTQLYNELLIIHWYRYDNFRGVHELLLEMEESGLTFNKETLEIVGDILRTQFRTFKRERGDVLKLLWDLPEFAPGICNNWYLKIKMLVQRTDNGEQLRY